MSTNDVQIYVTMLGEFTLREDAGRAAEAKKRKNNKEVFVKADLSGRSRRLWLLLAYLIVNRNRGVTSDELIDLLWPEASGSNPTAKLQNNVSRTRKMLADAGFTNANALVKCEKGSYMWNSEGTTVVDADLLEECAHRFESGVSSQEVNTALSACDLYKGDFLAHASGESWSVNLAIYYRSLFTRLASRTIRALILSSRFSEAENLCRQVISIDPASEEFSAFLMRSQTANGHPQKALDHYDYIKRVFKEMFGTDVSPELDIERELAMQELYGRSMGKQEIREFLNRATEDENEGAFFCSNAVFREIVQLQARDIARNGTTAQIVAISFSKQMAGAMKDNGEGTRRSKARVINVKRLENVLSEVLRGGDPFTKMGQDQFLILLPTADSINGQGVVERVLNRFRETYPNVEADFQTEVYPLDALDVLPS